MDFVVGELGAAGLLRYGRIHTIQNRSTRRDSWWLQGGETRDER